LPRNIIAVTNITETFELLKNQDKQTIYQPLHFIGYFPDFPHVEDYKLNQIMYLIIVNIL